MRKLHTDGNLRFENALAAGLGLTDSPNTSPLQLASSGLMPATERSEAAGDMGGDELVLPNRIVGGRLLPLAAKGKGPVPASPDWWIPKPGQEPVGKLVFVAPPPPAPHWLSSWWFLSLSMRSLLVPDTGRLRSLSSCFSSATCRGRQNAATIHLVRKAHSLPQHKEWPLHSVPLHSTRCTFLAL